jgi:hypothetical protein
VNIKDSTLRGNRATFVDGNGGGVYNAGQMAVTDSTISGNIDGRRRDQNNEGGGIYNAPGGTGTITSTTIAENRALGSGAAGGGIAGESGLTLTASIVAENEGGNCVKPVDDGGFNLENGRSCGFNEHAVNGKVVFLDRKRVLGKDKLNGKEPDTASIKVRLGSGRHRLKAEYKGSKLFLASRARP